MRRVLGLLLVAMVLVATSMVPADARTWKDVTGIYTD